MTMRCISCDADLKSANPYTTPLDQAPSDGLVVYTHGNYGSVLFDPMDGVTHLELYLCDACAETKAASIYHVTAGALRKDNVHVRFDEWLTERKRAEEFLMADPERLKMAQRLGEAKHDAGVHPEHGVVIYFSNRIWRVAGGDPRSPSLIGLAGVRVTEVTWLKPGHRPEPVT